MRMKWSRQVDDLTLKFLISIHHHRSELNMKHNSDSSWEPAFEIVFGIFWEYF